MKVNFNKLRPIPKKTRDFLEDLISSYHSIKKEIKEIKENIILEAPYFNDGGIPQTATGDTVLSKTIKIIDSKRLQHMVLVVKAIEQMFENLDEPKKELIRVRFWCKDYTDFGAARILNIGNTTFYKWKTYILWVFGIEMGYLDANQMEYTNKQERKGSGFKGGKKY